MASDYEPNSSNIDEELPSPTQSTDGSVKSMSTAAVDREEQEVERVLNQSIEELTKSLWPRPTSFKDRLIVQLRGYGIFSSLLPSPANPVIERLSGGDLNHITSITLPESCTEKDRHLILRIPRYDQSRLDREVATLNYVCQKTDIPVAKIASTDFSCNNALGKPYVLQHRVPGTDLCSVWNTLSHSQRCVIAAELGRIVRTLLSVESPVCGLIETSSTDAEPSACFNVVPFEIQDDDDEEDAEPLQRASQDSMTYETASRTRQSTLEIFQSLVSQHRAIALKHNCGEIDHEVSLWDNMLSAVHQMDSLKLFRPDTNCLCHVDLHAGNMMVITQASNPNNITITAILDWDEAIFAPKFMNCRPLTWLWDDHDLTNHQMDENGLDPWPYEIDGANATPATLEKQELKRVFEEQAGEEYVRLAYEEFPRLCRGLFRIAKDGLEDSSSWKAAERILREWEVLKEGSGE